MKNFLSIAGDVALHVGADTPSSLITAERQTDADILRCIIETGEDLHTRFDWPQLRKKAYILGPGDAPMNFPSTYARLIQSSGVKYNGQPLRGSLSDSEFSDLTAVAGTPRYFRTTSTSIEVWPWIADPQQIDIVYIGKSWIATGVMDAYDDADEPVFDDVLVRMGAIWRFRRMKGQAFQDHFDEAEAALESYSGFAVSKRGPA